MPEHYLPSATQGVVPEYFSTVTRSMPAAYWDGYFQFLLELIVAEYPEWPQSKMINLALGNLQLAANGDAALRSLAVSDIYPEIEFISQLLIGSEY